MCQEKGTYAAGNSSTLANASGTCTAAVGDGRTVIKGMVGAVSDAVVAVDPAAARHVWSETKRMQMFVKETIARKATQQDRDGCAHRPDERDRGRSFESRSLYWDSMALESENTHQTTTMQPTVLISP